MTKSDSIMPRTDSHKKKRLEHIDAMRGVMIILVVYFHLLLSCIYPNVGFVPSPFAEVLQRVRMPLFFCISGFFAYGIYDRQLFKKRLNNRVRKQLLPTIVTFALFVAVVSGSLVQGLIEYVFVEGKKGYWFTYSLFQVWFIYAVLSLFLHEIGVKETIKLLVFSLLTILLLPANLIISRYYPWVFESDFSKLLSLSHDISLMPFFFMGVIVRMLYPVIESKINELSSKLDFAGEGIVMAVAALAIFVLSANLWSPIQIRISEVIGVVAVITAFIATKEYWSNNSKSASYLRLLGKNTLPIYLFHYFILYGVEATHLLDWMGRYVGLSIIEIPVLIFASVLIAHACMMFDVLIKRNHYVNSYVFGN